MAEVSELDTLRAPKDTPKTDATSDAKDDGGNGYKVKLDPDISGEDADKGGNGYKVILDPDTTGDAEDKGGNGYKLILEPALIGAMMAINLGQTSLQNFYLRTACTVDLGLPGNVCDSGVGEEFRSAEKLSQEVVANVNISRSFVGCVLATVILLFVGPWSDCSGRRKPLIILPLVGMSVMTAAVITLLTFPGASTVYVLYAAQIPISLGGNFGLLLAASFSHIGDVCHASGRDVTRTMGAHRASIQVANVVGCLCGPLLYRTLGFYGVFPVVLMLQLSALTYVIIAVKDVNVNRDNAVSVFSWRLPLNAARCLVRARGGGRRRIILLLMVVALGDRVLLSAEVLLAYMYYRRKFYWDDVLFGSFLAYRNIVSFLGTLLILTVLKKSMKLSDEVVGLISCVSFVVMGAGLVAAQTTLVVFILPIIGIISQGSQVVNRPLLNKQILPTEQGKIYSVMGALESATQTVSSPLYSFLYFKTVETSPDVWLAPGIVLASIQATAYLTVKYLRRKNKRQDVLNKIEGVVDVEKHKNIIIKQETFNDSEQTKELMK